MHMAMVHFAGCAARSFRNHLSSGEPVPHPPIRSHSELIATMCQLPRSKLYQPVPAVPARLPKYRKYPDAFDRPYSWLPTTGVCDRLHAPPCRVVRLPEVVQRAAVVLQVAEREHGFEVAAYEYV